MGPAAVLSRSTRRFVALCIVVSVLLLLLPSTDVDARRRRRRKGYTPPDSDWQPPNRQHHQRSRGQNQVGHLQEAEEADQTVDRAHRAHSMLVLQWPESLCASEKRGCIGPIHPYLTLHGVWPIERRLVNCRADFDPESLATMAANLTAVWPSYFHRNSMNFWKHEYDKHGSCLAGTIEEYFDASLRLHSKYSTPLLSLLNPSDHPRPLEYFTAAIKHRFGGEPMIMCRTNWVERRAPGRRVRNDQSMSDSDADEPEEDGYDGDVESDDAPSVRKEQLLVEVGLCFAPDGATVVDCPPRGRIRRCRRGQNVLVPPRGTFMDV